MLGKNRVRLFIGIAIALFAIIKYCSSSDINPYTGKEQHTSLSPEEEIAIGLQSAPQMAQQYGGLHPNNKYQVLVDQVGNKLIKNSIAAKTPYQFEFHLLADKNVINAFALPGGQVFITYALFSQLQNEDQLAGVLGHEVGHVVGRHSANRISKQGLTQGLLSGVAIGSDNQATTEMAAVIANVVNMKYGRDDELESDDLGVKFMLQSGYNPKEMIGVMEILKKAAGSKKTPEFQSTHPDPENRIGKIEEAIEKYKTL